MVRFNLDWKLYINTHILEGKGDSECVYWSLQTPAMLSLAFWLAGSHLSKTIPLKQHFYYIRLIRYSCGIHNSKSICRAEASQHTVKQLLAGPCTSEGTEDLQSTHGNDSSSTFYLDIQNVILFYSYCSHNFLKVYLTWGIWFCQCYQIVHFCQILQFLIFFVPVSKNNDPNK